MNKYLCPAAEISERSAPVGSCCSISSVSSSLVIVSDSNVISVVFGVVVSVSVLEVLRVELFSLPPLVFVLQAVVVNMIAYARKITKKFLPFIF
mgnify:CR=1 FL=1